jgi:hypothetical protein
MKIKPKEAEFKMKVSEIKPKENQNQPADPQKRNFLKSLLIGGGSFLLGFFLRSLGIFDLFSKSKENEIPLGEDLEFQPGKDLGEWTVVKKGKQMVFVDKKTKEEVLILDQED